MKKMLLTTLFFCLIATGVMAQSGGTYTDIRVDLCEGEKYQIRGRQIDSTGVYYDTLLIDSQGNDSIVRYIINFHPTYNIYDTMQICQGDSVYFCNGFVKDEGDYMCHYLTAVYGCDSIRHLHLTVNPNIVSIVDTTTCETGFYFYNQYYTTAGTYDHVVKMQTGCDEIHRLILKFDTAKHTDVYVEVCENSTYVIGGDTVAATGIYTDTMLTTRGCDSVIRYIFNVKYPNYHYYDTAAICQGESYQYHGKSFTIAGDYTRSYTSVHGCDSIYHLHLKVNDNYHITVYDTICSNETFTINGKQVESDGVYTQVFRSVTGCDSIVDRHVTIRQSTFRDVHIDVCEGETFDLRGKVIPATGVYYDTLVNDQRCDSIVRYIFNVHPTYDIHDTMKICEGDSVMFCGKYHSIAGDYTYRYTSKVSGCDSVHHLHLTVGESYLTEWDTTLCAESYQFFDQRLTESGTYDKHFLSVNGCDSTYRVNLTLHKPVTVDLPYDACFGDSVIINNVKIPATGIYVDRQITSDGCDSIVRYIFNVHNRFEQYVDETICEGDTLHFHGEELTAAGDYTLNFKTAHGCDSIYHLHLTVGESYLFEWDTTLCAESYQFFDRRLTESGTYDQEFRTAGGCDSTYRVNLTLHKPVTVDIPYDACEGDSALINGVLIPATGIYTIPHVTSHGCDSIVRYIFNVHNRFEQYVDETICEGDTLHFHGEEFTAAGDYTLNFKTAHECDSIYHLHLTVKRSFIAEWDTTLCAESYQFFSQRLTESGTYDQTFRTAEGCDSTYRVNLTLYKPVTVDVQFDACYDDSTYINGKHIPAKGVYIDSLYTSNGCDSIVRYIFNVHNTFEQYDTASICNGGSYNFHGQQCTLTGDYVQHYQTIHGCDSIYHLHLTAYDNYYTTKDSTICLNDGFAINGQQVLTTGTYYENYITTHGCDSVIEWHITVNQPSFSSQTIEVCQGETYDLRGKKIPAMGVYNDTLVNSQHCDSIVQYIFNVHPTYDLYDTATICEGDSVLFCGDYITIAGDYTRQYQAVVNGCDSVLHLHLTVNRSYLFESDTTVCAHVFNFFNQSLTESGTYEQKYKTTAGCDSIYRVHLNIYHPVQIDIPFDVCYGDSATVNGVRVAATGIYTMNFKTTHGCDSVVRYIFNVHNRFEHFDSAAICQGDSFLFQGTYISAAGDYTRSYQTAPGCDSTYHLHLTVNPSYHFTRDTTICSNTQFYINGQPVQTSGTYYEHYHTAQSCDSTIEWHITVNYPSFSTQTIEVCQGETYDLRGKQIPAMGDYYDTLRNSKGCDSIVHYIFNVHPTYDLFDTLTICEGDSVLFCGDYVSAAGDYTRQYQAEVNGCDSVRHLHLTVNPSYLFESDTSVCGYTFRFFNRDLTQSGTYEQRYTTKEGCDSIYRIHLTLNNHTFSYKSFDACQGETFEFRGETISKTSVFYDTLVNAAGCDSIIEYKFNIHPSYDIYDTLRICEGDSVEYCDEYFKYAGDYTRNFRTVHGCDSSRHLHLIVNRTYRFVTDTTICGTEFYFHNHYLTDSGTYVYNHLTVDGCDSVYILHLKLYKPVTVDITYEACDGDSAYINGKHIPAKGIYVDSFFTTHGCDSIVRYIFNVHNRFEQYDTFAICQGESYAFHGDTFNIAGDYVRHFQTVHGCDSSYYLHLIVNNNYYEVRDTAICANDGFAIDGQQVLTSGTYYQSFKTTQHCDSVIEWHITVKHQSYRDIHLDVCQGESYNLRGKLIPATGTYNDTLVNSAGCDSIVQYIFNVHPTYDIYDTLTICDGDSAQFCNEYFKAAGDYTRHYQAKINGCDSVRHLHLIVNRSYTFDTTVVACGYVYDYQGMSLTASGTYQKRYTTTKGCDSIYNITLKLYQPTITDLTYDACDGDSAYINGVKVLASGVYVDTLTTSHGCDSIVRHIFNVHHRYEQFDTANICQGDTFMFHGRMLVAEGDYHENFRTFRYNCDSIFHLHLNVYPSYKFVTDTSICGTEYFFHNHTLTESGSDTVRYTTIHGCDSLYIINLNLYKPVQTDVLYYTCDGDSAYINGVKVLASGTYLDTMRTSHGCDSIVRHVFNVHPRYEQFDTTYICEGDTFMFHGTPITVGGNYNKYLKTVYQCDSIFHLHVISYDTFYTRIDTTICSNHRFVLRGTQIDSSGTYYLRYHTIHGCDSTIEYNVTVVPITIIPTRAAICDGDTYQFRGRDITKSGVYDDTLYNHSGCDIIYRLVLDVYPSYHITEADHVLCQTDLPTMWQGQPVTTSGVYNAYLKSIHQCDSIITTNFVVHDSQHIYETIRDCSGLPYHWEDTVITTPGDYSRHYYTTDGCDSIRHLHYDTIPPTVTINETICEGDYYDFRGHRYNQTGTYVHHFIDSMGCDTTYTINLSVDTANRVSELYFDLCNQTLLDYGGKIYTQSGIYYDTLFSAAGCQHITKLHINLGRDTVINQFFNICEGSTATFRGQTYTTSGIYHDTAYTAAGCKIAYLIVVNVNPLPTLDYETMHVCMPDDSIMFDGVYYKPGTYFFSSNSSVAPCLPHHRLTVVSDYFFHDTTVTMCHYNLPYVNPYTGRQYNATGVYFENYTTQYLGCDSIYRIDLRVNYSGRRVVYDTVYNCSGSPYIWQDTARVLAGDYTVVLTSSTGCDSIIHLHYETTPPPVRNITKTICAGDYFDFRGRRFNQAGTHTVLCPGPLGCDTTYIIHLSVDNTASYQEVAYSDCSDTRYVFHGKTYTKCGVYFDTLYSTNGCMQVTKLTLNIGSDTLDTTLYICESGTLTFRGKTYTQSGTYRDTLVGDCGCPEYYRIHVNVLPAMYYTDTLDVCGSQQAYSLLTHQWYSKGVYDFYQSNGEDACPDHYHIEVRDWTAYHDTIVTICHDALPFVHPYTHKSYNAHGIYHDTLYNSGPISCPTYYTLTLNVITDHNRQEFFDTVYDCSGVPFNWQGLVIQQPGDYTQTYVDRFHCDSVHHLHYVTSGPTFNISHTMCLGDYFLFRGRRFSTAGTYTFTVPASGMGVGLHQCDTTFNVTINVDNSGYYQTLDTTVCSGYFSYNGRNYTRTGIYYDTLYSNSGCLQVTQLDLKIGKDTIIDTFAVICEGTTLTFYNTTYSVTGTYCYNLLGRYGCTETHCLHLSVLPVMHYDTTDYVCGPSQTVLFKGNRYGPGVYTFADPYDTARCPDVYTLTVIDESDSTFTTAEICENDAPYVDPNNGRSYWHTGVYHDILYSPHGCPIPYTLTLTVNNVAKNVVYDTICKGDPYPWNGMVFYDAVDTQYVIPRGSLCDSIDVLYLTAIDRTTDYYDTICQGDIYEWMGGYYTTSGTYTHQGDTYNGCTHIDNLHLMVTPPVKVNTVSAENVCGPNGSMDISVDVTFASGSSAPTYYYVTFDAKGHAEGLKDTSGVFTGTPFTIDYGYRYVPNDTNTILRYVRPDIYNMTVRFDNGACSEHLSTSYTTVEMKYPADVLDENWHDVVAVFRRNHCDFSSGLADNYEFSWFQWYDNGSPAGSGSLSYYYKQGADLTGHQISARLTRKGESQACMTCPLTFEPNDDKQTYPTITGPWQMVRHQEPYTEFSAEEGGVYYLYTVSGQLVHSATFDADERVRVTLPAVQSYYIIRVVTNSIHETYKILVY